MKKERPNLAESFLALLRPIRGELEVFSRRLVWNEQDAPDAIQNAVLNAFKAFDRYHENTNFRAWMFTILTREVFKLNKKFARLAQSEFQVEPDALDALPALEQSAQLTDWLNSPAALADALDQQLLAALRTLTETERAVLLLRGIGEFRYREIAGSLEIPMGSVMGHLARARKKMQDALLSSQRRSVL
ncbi:MAG: sigma-70 family RNA polymerase sigma factor [Verrucomicrobia subdivision 3 bacterium]|nr:sigma-70 family RNA polymerase sigma factor [Limisphaerales bacterium]